MEEFDDTDNLEENNIPLRRSKRNIIPETDENFLIKLADSETNSDDEDESWEECESVCSDVADSDSKASPLPETGKGKKRLQQGSRIKNPNKSRRINRNRRKIDDMMCSLTNVTEKNMEILKLLLKSQNSKDKRDNVDCKFQDGSFNNLAACAGQMVTSHLIYLGQKDKKHAYKKYKEIMNQIFTSYSENPA